MPTRMAVPSAPSAPPVPSVRSHSWSAVYRRSSGMTATGPPKSLGPDRHTAPAGARRLSDAGRAARGPALLPPVLLPGSLAIGTENDCPGFQQSRGVGGVSSLRPDVRNRLGGIGQHKHPAGVAFFDPDPIGGI